MSLTVVTGPGFVQGNPPAGIVMPSSIGIGQVMVAIVQGGIIPTGATVSDNVNSGNYSLLAQSAAGNIGIYWIVTNASGTPTVTLATPGGYSYISICAITGFSGTPTADTLLSPTATTGTSTNPLINASSNFNNEVLLVGFFEANTYADAITVSGWSGITGTHGPTQQPGFYAVEATAGTANNFSGTISPSQQWWLTVGGVYDAAAANSATIAWIT